MISRRKIGLFACLAGLAVLTAAASKPIMVNTTPSEPEGVYVITGGLSRSPAIGAYVAACPPLSPILRLGVARHYLAAGTCPDGTVPLLKQVEAVHGDRVDVTAAGVIVNGRRLPNTAPVPRDQTGRPLPHYPFGRYRVKAGQVWLLSTYSPRSFDSRYFGPVPASSIVATVRPVWTDR